MYLAISLMTKRNRWHFSTIRDCSSVRMTPSDTLCAHTQKPSSPGPFPITGAISANHTTSPYYLGSRILSFGRQSPPPPVQLPRLRQNLQLTIFLSEIPAGDVTRYSRGIPAELRDKTADSHLVN